jgi:hypothetical protein
LEVYGKIKAAHYILLFTIFNNRLSGGIKMAKFWEWESQEVIRNRWPNKGRKAKVLKIWEGLNGNPIMNVKYADTDKKAFYCHPHDYTFSVDWRDIFYKPRRRTVERAKSLITDEGHIINFSGKRYIPILYDLIPPKLIECLLVGGFLKKAGWLGRVLTRNGSSWEKYWQDRKKQGLPWLDRHTTTYQILKDITKFAW